MRFLRCSYDDVQGMPEGYDDMAIEISRREAQSRRSRQR